MTHPESPNGKLIIAAMRLCGLLAMHDVPSATELEACEIHAEGIRQENPDDNESCLACLLAMRIAPIFKVPVPAVSGVQWFGDSTEGPQISYAYGSATTEEIADAVRFYVGAQWDPEIEKFRLSMGRPCLVVNRLPAIMQRILGNGPVPDAPTQDLLIAEIVRRNRDAQKAYNYMVSSVVERMRVKPQHIVDTDAIGEATYDAFWRGQPGQIFPWSEMQASARKRWSEAGLAAVKYYRRAETVNW